MSPAITPVFNGGYANAQMSSMNNDMTFSPLSSPALHPLQQSPHLYGDMQQSNPFHDDIQSAEAILQRKLALIEQQQQQLLALQQQQKLQPSQSGLVSPRLQSSNKRMNMTNSKSSPYQNNYNSNVKRQATLRQKIAMSSPQLQSSMATQQPRRHSGGYQSLSIAQHSPVQHPSEDTSMPPPPFPQQSYSAPSPHALQPSLAPASPSALAPATPASLMKLSGRSSASSSGTTSPVTNAVRGDLGYVDNMPNLPEAILPMMSDVSSSPHSRPESNMISPALKPTVKRKSSNNRKNSKREPFASPIMAPNLGPSPRMSISDPTIVMSPAALRPQVLQSPRALKPLISPSLKPNWPPTQNAMVDQEAAAQILASKSNYQNLREGKIASLGMQFSPSIHSGIEIRRTAHKAAEQRRRDTLKKSFDCLRNEIVGSLVNEVIQDATDGDSAETIVPVEADLRKEKEKEVKQMSKVVLLQHSFEYIVRLKDDNRLKDTKLDRAMQKLRELRKQAGLPEVTEEELEEEERDKAEAKRQRLERTERLANSQREEEENSGNTRTSSTAPSNEGEETE